VTHDTRIGECDACHARFKVPASFRADRARCRECGGVVVLEHARPVPRPPLEKSRKSKPADPGPRRDEPKDQRAVPVSSRSDKQAVQRSDDIASEHVASGSHHVAQAPTHAGGKPGAARADHAKPAHEKKDSAPAKDEKKSGGVLGSIVAAAKAAVWRKKRGK
jgi:hypothetical protein